MSSKIEDENAKEEKLEDIIRSIKGMIYSHTNYATNTSDQKNYVDSGESVLELTTEFIGDKKEGSELISKNTAEKILSAIDSFTQKIDNSHLTQANKRLDIEINNLIKPMLKDWLDHNLPRLVEKVIAEELKNLIQKK